MDKKPLGYYNYTVILTYVGMLAGFLAIVFVMQDCFASAMVCLMISGVCDMFDGTIAANKVRTADEKCFGIQIDSLSDVICFGVMPALAVVKMSSFHPAALVVCGLYTLCALIRLAYFNVDEQNRQCEQSCSRTIYKGLPVTSIALTLPLFWMLNRSLPVPGNIICILGLLVTAILFLTPFRLKKPHTIGKVVMVVFGLAEFAVLVIKFGKV